MEKTIRTVYTGDLRTTAEHLRSGNKLITDAPIDNKGKGEAFSPTDLLATSLGSCMLTIIGISAREHGFSIDGCITDITKIMASNPRRVKEIIVEFNFPNIRYTAKQKKIIEKAASTCPSSMSLHPDLIQTILFNYYDEQL